MFKRKFFKIWLLFHIIKCRYWNLKLKWQMKKMSLALIYPLEYKEWYKSHYKNKKDKSWSANDFRFWLYNIKINK